MIYGELTKLSDANERERTDVRMITNKNTQTKIHVTITAVTINTRTGLHMAQVFTSS